MWKIGDSVLGVLIGGGSLLDSRLGLSGSFRNLQDADDYLLAYGFDLHDPIEAAELQGTVQEAIRFIQKYFLKPQNPDGLPLEVPKKIIDCQDVRELLMYASSDVTTSLHQWACSVLKVVHTISHVDRDMRTPYFIDIQKQIFDRFYRYLHRDENDQLYLGRSVQDPLRVDLVEFQIKPKKARDSMLMKLLHKSESVAEEVFDRVGIRFVTRTRFDAVRVIHFLEHCRVIVAANIKPSRSRNTLMDTTLLAQAFDVCEKKIAQNLMTEEESIQYLESVPPPESVKAADNPFSSVHYRAIQFTCRQLIKLKSPLGDQIRDLKNLSKIQTKESPLSAELLAAIDRVDSRLVQRVVRFFYPFEVQAMDDESHAENEKGRSAHKAYKLAQQNAAMMRVMGPLANPKSET